MRKVLIGMLATFVMASACFAASHRLQSDLEDSRMEAIGKAFYVQSVGGVLFAWGPTASVPNAVAGYAPGCLFIDTTTGTVYKNSGTASSCDFGSGVAGTIASGSLVVPSGSSITLESGASLDFESGSTWDIASTTVTSAAADINAATTRVLARNEGGSELVKGTLVRLSGWSGGAVQLPLISGASPTNGILATHVVPVSIANGASGYVDGECVVTGLNTSSWTDAGDAVYMTASGQPTPTIPTGANQHVQEVGRVTVKDATVGEILFFPSYSVVSKFGTAGYQTGSVTSAKLDIDADVQWVDGIAVTFGGSDDVNLEYDGVDSLVMTPATDDASTFDIGDGTTDMDFKIFLGSVGEYAQFDVGDSAVKFVGVPLTVTGATTVGQDAAGHDVIFYGDTSGKKWWWDQANDKVELDGWLDIDGYADVDANEASNYGHNIYNAGAGGGLFVNSGSTGNVFDFQDGGTSVLTYPDGGPLTLAGAIFMPDDADMTFGNVAATPDIYMGWDTDATDMFVLRPQVDDTVFRIGNATTTSMDILWNAGAAADNIEFDASDKEVTFDGVDLIVNDADILYFGDGKDIYATFTTPNLQLLPTITDTGAVHIGNGTLDMDFKVFMDSTAAFVNFDQDAQEVIVEGAKFNFMDNDAIEFGDTADAKIAYDTTDANANALLLDLPTGGATDVPVLAIGQGIVATDLTLFDGLTETRFAVLDADDDSYLALDFSADDTPRILAGGGATTIGIGNTAIFESDAQFGDDDEILMGGVASVLYDTTDANANAMIVELPAGGATDVPVLVVGQGVDGTDLALFDGITETTVAVVDTDGDSYVALDFSADDTPRIMAGGGATEVSMGVGLNLDGVTLSMNDNDAIVFGDSPDMAMDFDSATNMLMVLGTAQFGVGIDIDGSTGHNVAGATNASIHGGSVAITTGKGGTSETGDAGNAGDMTLAGADGGAGSGAAADAGDGGAIAITSGTGGADGDGGSGTGGDAGSIVVTLGDYGAGAATGAAGLVQFLPTTDDHGAVNIGDGTTDMDFKVFMGAAGTYVNFDNGSQLVTFEGTDLQLMDGDQLNLGDTSGGDATVSYVAATHAVTLDPKGSHVVLPGLSNRYELERQFGGVHGIPESIGSYAYSMVIDPQFMVEGTNSGDGCTVAYAEGGITLAVISTADGNEAILSPNSTAGATWDDTTWGSDKSVRYEALITTSASIANQIIWVGLKLTNTEVTITDADQAFFRYEDGVATGNWQAITSVADSDDAADSGVTVAINTTYHLVVDIDSSRIPKYYINGVLVETGGALTDTTDFKPYIGIADDGAAADNSMIVHSCAISRAYN